MTDQVTVDSHSQPWNIVFSLAEHSDTDSWLLVGGLMVQAHALLAGLETRATVDADFLVDLITTPRAVDRITRILSQQGFQIKYGTLTGYTTRMVGRAGIVDLLVADHLPRRLEPAARLAGYPMLEVPAGAQAIERSQKIALIDGSR